MSGRAVVGPALVLVGACHVSLTPVLYPAGTASLVSGGIIDSVQSDPALAAMRGLPFWFATTGVALLGLGAVVTAVERQERPIPRSLPWILAGIGGWGRSSCPSRPSGRWWPSVCWPRYAFGDRAFSGRRRVGD